VKYLTDMDDLAHTLHHRAKAKGFYEPYENIDEKDYVIFYLKQLAMVHSEVTEVLEAIRKDKGDNLVVEELADILIRVLDFWAFLNETGYTKKKLSDALNEKIAVNEERPHMHGVLA
jgi:NTP pyrophosphatase (non-canonical NTP hydrolase)